MAQPEDKRAKSRKLLGELADNWGLTFLTSMHAGLWNTPRPMKDLDWYLEGEGLSSCQIFEAGSRSKAYGGGKFDPKAPYFAGDAFDLFSISADRMAEFVREVLNGGDDDEFIAWCVEDGYVDEEWAKEVKAGLGDE